MKLTKLILCLPAMVVAAPLAAKHKKPKEPWPGKSEFVGPSDWDLDAIPCPKCNLWARPDMRHSGDKEDYDALYVAPLIDRAQHSTYGDENHINRPQIHGDPTYQSRPTLIHDDSVHALQERNVIPKPKEGLRFVHINKPNSVLYHHREDNLYRCENLTATKAGFSNPSTVSYANTTLHYQTNTTETLKHIEEILRHEIGPNWAPKSRIHARQLPNGLKLFDTQLPQTKNEVSEAQLGTKSAKRITLFPGLVHNNGHWDGVARSNPYVDPHPDCEPGDHTYRNEKCVGKLRSPDGEADRKAHEAKMNSTEHVLVRRGPPKPYPILLDLPKYPGEDLMKDYGQL
jgi:hypothetical protein